MKFWRQLKRQGRSVNFWEHKIESLYDVIISDAANTYYHIYIQRYFYVVFFSELYSFQFYLLQLSIASYIKVQKYYIFKMSYIIKCFSIYVVTYKHLTINFVTY